MRLFHSDGEQEHDGRDEAQAEPHARPRRSRATVTYPLHHLTVQLDADTPALALTSDRLDQYILDRRAEGASNASIRIELALLSKGFTLALRARKLRTKPYIPKPESDPTRSGTRRVSLSGRASLS